MIKVEEKKRRIEASFLDDLFRDLSKSMFQGLVDRVEAGARELVGWSLRRLAMSVVAMAIVITAATLLLIAAVEGLREASLPPSLAYLFAGLLGMGVGIGLMFWKR
ncbi:MAG TPA: hypothetical protein VE981_07710 [Planctomycetota bacterium]|nr:hypothetical protein [Planctomycetota bacterium]